MTGSPNPTAEPAGTPGAGVRPATPEDLPTIERALGLAFADDPVWQFVIRKRDRFAQRVGTFLGMVARAHLDDGTVFVTDDGAAAAIWAPPKRWRIEPQHVLGNLWSVTRAGGLGVWRRFPAMAEIERQHPSGAHWYLAVIGTEPAHQGHGLGSALLAPMLQRCDEEGLGAYLESSKQQNIPYYERHGFRVTGTIQVPKGGPTLWPMWREAT